MKRRTALTAGLIPLLAGPRTTRAEALIPPLLRIVVPFAPGGGSDIIARALAQELREILGNNVIVENRAGANGAIGAQAVARSAPDASNVIICSPGVQITNPLLYRSLAYDPNDLMPVVMVAKLPNLLVVHPSVPARNVAELITLAKEPGDRLNYSSTGIGASSHLACELFRLMADIQLTHVPYAGSAPALIDLAAGRVQMTIDSFTVMYRRVQAGELRALGVSSAQRLPEFPDIPTIAETLPGFEGSSMVYMAARAGSPAAAVERLNQGFNQALQAPPIASRYATYGMAAPIGGSPADLAAIIESERVKWRGVIESAGIQKQ